MAETSLITISEVQEFERIDSKFNQSRFDAYIKEVQRKNLRNLLGDALYYAFMNDDRTSGIYKTLLDGETYTFENETIEYYGIKPFLIYSWLALATRRGDTFIATHGAVNFTNNPQQHFETSKDKQRIAAEYAETAQGYANDIIKYLNENNSDYPLWDSDQEVNTSQFISFRL